MSVSSHPNCCEEEALRGKPKAHIHHEKEPSKARDSENWPLRPSTKSIINGDLDNSELQSPGGHLLDTDVPKDKLDGLSKNAPEAIPLNGLEGYKTPDKTKIPDGTFPAAPGIGGLNLPQDVTGKHTS